MLSFTAPWAALALPLPLLVWWLMPPAPARGALPLPIASELLALAGGTQGRARLPGGSVVAPLLGLLAWLALVAAAMQPVWTGEPVALPASGRDLMLAVDVSGSMDEQDMVLGRRRVNRLLAVQELAADFIARREGDRIGLVLFGRQAYVYSPLSLDRATVSTLLRQAEVGLAGRETAIGDAIALGVKRLRESRADDKVLILLTDGVNTAGSIDPDRASALAAQAGIRIHTIGFGSDGGGGFFSRGSGMDEQQLQRVANATGGRFFRARDTAALQDIYAAIDKIEPVEIDERTFRPTRALFYWPLTLAVLLAVLIVLLRQLGTIGRAVPERFHTGAAS